MHHFSPALQSKQLVDWTGGWLSDIATRAGQVQLTRWGSIELYLDQSKALHQTPVWRSHIPRWVHGQLVLLLLIRALQLLASLLLTLHFGGKSQLAWKLSLLSA